MASTLSKDGIVNKNLIFLLELIRKKTDVQLLLREGLTYSQISALIGDAIREGFLDQTETSFVVSEKGEQYLATREAREQYGAPGKWVLPDKNYVIAQIDLNDIYLPKLKDSKFLGT